MDSLPCYRIRLPGRVLLNLFIAWFPIQVGGGGQAATLQEEQPPAVLYDTARRAMQKKDYRAAENFLRQVLAQNPHYQEPSGRSAWHQLGMALERQDRMPDAIHTLEQGRDSLQFTTQRDWYLIYDLARLYAEYHAPERQNEITEMVYEVFKNSVPAQQADLWQRLFEEMAFILEEDERSQLKKALSKSDRQAGRLLLRFFRREDPFLSTSANEGLIIFFQRTAEARKRFGYSASPRGYDERGEIYVRLGKPWRIHSDHSGTMGDVGWAIYPNEVWFYNTIHSDLYFTFYRKEGRLEYRLTDGPESLLGSFYSGRRTFFNRQNVGETATILRNEIYRNLAPSHETFRNRLYEISNLRSSAEAVDYSLLHFTNEDRKHAARLDSIAPAVVFNEDHKLESIPVALSFARFRDADGKTRTELYYGSLYRDLKFKRSDQGYHAQLRGEIALLNEDYELVNCDSIRQNLLAVNSTAKDTGEFVGQADFITSPGRYHLFFRLENPNGEQVEAVRHDLEVIPFPEAAFSLSDIQLSPDIHESNESHRFVKNGYFVVPLPALNVRKERPLFVYFEIYHLSTDASGETMYRVDYRVSALERKKGFFKKLIGIFVGSGEKKHSVTLSATRLGHRQNEVEHVELDIGEFASGDFELEIIVTDVIAKQEVSSKVPFKMR